MRTGFKVVTLDTVDSTNNYIAILLKKGEITNGTVILADNQYGGRGQRGSNWQSAAGENLTCSIFLDEVNLSVEKSFNLTKWISVSLVNYLNRIGFETTIKWPNDIFISDKKVAGILIENQLRGVTIKSSIIGIGLNVNQTNFGELRATSLKLETGEFKPIKDVLYGFLGYLSENPLSEINESDLSKKYHSKLFRFQMTNNYKDEKGEFTGKIIGVEFNGNLKLEKEDGSVFSYDLKEIEYLFA